eukprot:gnl/MRDRNA2_/MRDRNA2_74563_c0_seq1.p1 gnl/MRDRNA2_/MRDRNA2_74563_c0~~gnl/MRDRNA2_/MRDRNA2_74563_c0_seq1.p1  ORF type:complete len:671 (-),score=136.29 gnl/MRDRNA2_/MRDRNA2_74563_c0_seq1:4-1719(-)
MASTVFVMGFLNYFFGILGLTLVGDAPSFSDSGSTMEHFGGLDQSMFTLLQVVTGDAWASQIARPVLRIMPLMWMYFLAYIVIGVFVLMNLITAVIVENALQLARDNEEDQLEALDQCRKKNILHLKELFNSFDSETEGCLTENEFYSALTFRSDIIAKFKLLDFHDEEIDDLFNDLDTGDKILEVQEFVNGLLAMQGEAKSKDLIRVKKSVERVHKKLDAVVEILAAQFQLSSDKSEQLHGYKKIKEKFKTPREEKKAALKQKLEGGRFERGSEASSLRFSSVESIHKIDSISSVASSQMPDALKPKQAMSKTPKDFVPTSNLVLAPDTEPSARTRSCEKECQTEKDDVLNERTVELNEPIAQSKAVAVPVLDTDGRDAKDSEQTSKQDGPAAKQVGTSLVTVCKEIQKVLDKQIDEIQSYISEVCRTQIDQQRQLKSSSTVVEVCGQQGAAVDGMSEAEVRALALQHVSTIKVQLADMCRSELVRQLDLPQNGASDRQPEDIAASKEHDNHQPGLAANTVSGYQEERMTPIKDMRQHEGDGRQDGDERRVCLRNMRLSDIYLTKQRSWL